MAEYGHDTLALGLYLVAATTASLFTGASIYVSLVQYRAMRHLGSHESAVESFQSWYPLAARHQATLATLTALATALLWYLDPGHSALYSLTSFCFAATFAYTVVSIMPINKQLMGYNVGRDGAKEKEESEPKQMDAQYLKQTVGPILALATADLFSHGIHKEADDPTHPHRNPIQFLGRYLLHWDAAQKSVAKQASEQTAISDIAQKVTSRRKIEQELRQKVLGQMMKHLEERELERQRKKEAEEEEARRKKQQEEEEKAKELAMQKALEEEKLQEAKAAAAKDAGESEEEGGATGEHGDHEGAAEGEGSTQKVLENIEEDGAEVREQQE
ncbi:hypothetical protein HK102_010755 [Quaeritorhiza haematococci]|nr:hypothetical protein HK102_010755 [Quaeritorhiza haematococci]